MKQDSSFKIFMTRMLPGITCGLFVDIEWYALAAGIALTFILLAIGDLAREHWED